MADAAARQVSDDATRIALKRAGEMAAVFMIGDGALGVLQPVRHVDLWRSPIPAVDGLVRPFAGKPGRRRAYGLLQIAAGLALAALLRRQPGGRSIDQKRGPSRPTRHSPVGSQPSAR
ncbi:hypothetical protein [Sphingomonas sp. Leaf412]|uniref:hypothetical protein n=1 Tax=Sphingomonas sp. Leaf412 TaxID=1736370 RepID=UPI001F369E93|nr:hypothetical protein [Sphingomonas sp. Leaf412]